MGSTGSHIKQAGLTNRLLLWLLLAVVGLGLVVPAMGIHSPTPFGGKYEASDPMRHDALIGEGRLPSAIGQPDMPTASLPTFLSQPLPPRRSSGIQPVPSLFVRHMPNDMASLPTAEKKQTFIRIVLPLVLQANRDIRREQLLLERARQRGNTGLLLKFAQKYRLDTSQPADQLLAELDRRVQEVPVSLALAQAAVESGWGSSRFTQQGNALYGQWAWTSEAGIKPLEASNSKAVIRSFPSLFASVRAYMTNLNSHWAYADFRAARYQMIEAGQQPTGRDLTAYLSVYAETREDYVMLLNEMITQNNLQALDEAQLIAPSRSS